MWGQVECMRKGFLAAVFTPPMYIISCVSLMPMSLTPSISSASGHPVPRLCNESLPHGSPSACEPPAPPLSISFTLDQPSEGALSVHPHIPCIPQHQSSLSQLRLSWRPRSLSCQSWSDPYQLWFESCAQTRLPPLLPRFRPHVLHPLQSSCYKSFHLQPYSRPSQPWQLPGVLVGGATGQTD